MNKTLKERIAAVREGCYPNGIDPDCRCGLCEATSLLTDLERKLEVAEKALNHYKKQDKACKIMNGKAKQTLTLISLENE